MSRFLNWLLTCVFSNLNYFSISTHGHPLERNLNFEKRKSLFTDDVRDLCLTMHLMYTLDEAGNRVYTLKVSHVYF